MNRFEQIALSKEKFILEMLNDHDLVKCLSHPSPDFLSGDLCNPADRYEDRRERKMPDEAAGRAFYRESAAVLHSGARAGHDP